MEEDLETDVGGCLRTGKGGVIKISVLMFHQR